ncbi:hypothetical protein [Pilimelia anulata]|uniref:hypothetical protein n=1 Tax=Pilimelia anulata TaxID=53371 RepID=UPI00166D91DF|nr:hypothetical protein [Pilimelia anulata]
MGAALVGYWIVNSAALPNWVALAGAAAGLLGVLPEADRQRRLAAVGRVGRPIAAAVATVVLVVCGIDEVQRRRPLNAVDSIRATDNATVTVDRTATFAVQVPPDRRRLTVAFRVADDGGPGYQYCENAVELLVRLRYAGGAVQRDLTPGRGLRGGAELTIALPDRVADIELRVGYRPLAPLTTCSENITITAARFHH